VPGFARFAQRPRSGPTLQSRAQVPHRARFFFFLPGFLRGGSRTLWSAATRAAAGGPGPSPEGGVRGRGRQALVGMVGRAWSFTNSPHGLRQQAVTARQAERAAEPGGSRAQRRREGCGGRRSRPASAGWSEAEPGAARPEGHARGQASLAGGFRRTNPTRMIGSGSCPDVVRPRVQRLRSSRSMAALRFRVSRACRSV
jgi:hypothetical protein